MKRHFIVCAVVAVASVAGGAGLVSCTSTHDSASRPAAGGSGDVSPGPRRLGEHWIQSDKLRAVMAQVSQHASKWPAGVPEDPESTTSPEARADAEQSFRDAAALADGLADAARQIPRSVADHPMSAEDRRGFQAEADRLRKHALDLGRAARGRKVEQMQRSLDQISSSCVSCHSQYRDFTGELEGRRASAE